MAEAVDFPAGVTVPVYKHASLGVGAVAVRGIEDSPTRAGLIVMGYAGGREWESGQTVSEGQEILGSGSRFRLLSVLSGVYAGERGHVSLTLVPGQGPWPRDVVVLAGDGPTHNETNELMLGGPDRDKATELRVTAWLPDEQHATAAEVAWYPAKWGRDLTLPADVRSVRLEPGMRVTFGEISAKVLAVQGASADHFARVVLELLPRPPS